MKSCVMYGVDPNQSNYITEANIQPPLKVLWKFRSSKSGVKRAADVYFDAPLAFGERVFTCRRVTGTKPVVLCLSADSGEVLWTLENDIVERIAVSCVSRDVLILAGEGQERIRGVDIESGRILWSNKSVPGQGSQFCLEDCSVVFSGYSADSSTCGTLQPEAGEIIWSRKTRHSCRPVAACNAGLLLVEDRGDNAFNGVVCCDANTGAEIWEKDFSELGRHKDLATGDIVPGRPGSVVSGGDAVYCTVNVGKSNQLYCLDARRGDLVWQMECAPGPMQPIVTDNELCWIAFGGEYYRVDARAGKVLVCAKLPDADSSFQSIGIVATGHLWYASSMELRAVTVETGELTWSWKNRTLVTGPTFGEDRLYAISFPPTSQVLCFVSS